MTSIVRQRVTTMPSIERSVCCFSSPMVLFVSYFIAINTANALSGIHLMQVLRTFFDKFISCIFHPSNMAAFTVEWSRVKTSLVEGRKESIHSDQRSRILQSFSEWHGAQKVCTIRRPSEFRTEENRAEQRRIEQDRVEDESRAQDGESAERMRREQSTV